MSYFDNKMIFVKSIPFIKLGTPSGHYMYDSYQCKIPTPLIPCQSNSLIRIFSSMVVYGPFPTSTLSQLVRLTPRVYILICITDIKPTIPIIVILFIVSTEEVDLNWSIVKRYRNLQKTCVIYVLSPLSTSKRRRSTQTEALTQQMTRFKYYKKGCKRHGDI